MAPEALHDKISNEKTDVVSEIVNKLVSQQTILLYSSENDKMTSMQN